METLDLKAQADALNQRFAGVRTLDVLRGIVGEGALGRMALVSSFGTESAVLLHLIAQVDPELEVIFVDTQKLFGETLSYRDELVGKLGLQSLSVVTPRLELIKDLDAGGDLHRRDGNLCCFIRKVEPLERALEGVTTWISGRKRFQVASRSELDLFEAVDGRLKVNPLANWSKDDLNRYFFAHGLPRHPLESKGYPSLGCAPCTTPIAPGEDLRMGRWRGQSKVECGIHSRPEGLGVPSELNEGRL